MQLEKKNKDLLEKQDYEINLATLTERNRIARDIHDNVGHLLSRSILQIGALLAINKDEETKKSFGLIKDTLSEAMDSIRMSVHDLHEESIDLQTEIQKLIDSFNFCPIKFDYDLETNLEKNIKYCFIAVTKEALLNIINHSNATNALVIIREHPALYQLVIQDNGSHCSYNSENGIGIKNITDRVVAVSGNVNISTDKGFRIFISIPKK
jgi:signal transduction histidine kinase